MSAQHKPTFKLSAAKRPVYQRLTPLAWGLIGLSVLVVVLVIAVVGVACSARPTAEPWNPTPTATVPPSPTEALPSPTATEWGQEWITPTPTEEPPCCPAWWSDQMTQDEDGRWWPPEEVTQMVKEHLNNYVEARHIAVLSDPPDLDALEQASYDWTSGTMLAGDLNALDLYRAGADSLSIIEWEACFLQAQNWSEDGLECTLGITCQDGMHSLFDPQTGELVGQEHMDSYGGVLLYRMKYDPYDGHWKLDDFLQILSGE